MKALVLTYHSHNISGAAYGENDHVSLAEDLETITREGGRIVPLADIAGALREGRIDGEGELWVGLSFDDGPRFDAHDFEHRDFGPQRGFLNILRDFRDRHGTQAQPRLHATSFVIASPEARAAMQAADECGYPDVPGWLADDWWRDAADSGLLEIGNHSWDHVHPVVARTAVASPERGDFRVVTTYPDADAEIRRAGVFIAERIGRPCRLFAYPHGHVNEYLPHDYLPHRAYEHEMEAAFGASGGWVEGTSSIWNIPRVVCGHDWKTADGLASLLRGEPPRDECAGETRGDGSEADLAPGEPPGGQARVESDGRAVEGG